MTRARLEVSDAIGRRVVEISKALFEIGRRETNDLRLAGSEVSRDHADIVTENGKIIIRDKNSRYGTYVNGEQVTERVLVPGFHGGASVAAPPRFDLATQCTNCHAAIHGSHFDPFFLR
jgi:hypothetical protein